MAGRRSAVLAAMNDVICRSRHSACVASDGDGCEQCSSGVEAWQRGMTNVKLTISSCICSRRCSKLGTKWRSVDEVVR